MLIFEGIAAQPTFADVPTYNTFYKQIEWLAYSGISAGWIVVHKEHPEAEIAVTDRGAVRLSHKVIFG